MKARPATSKDTVAIAAIYNEGIKERTATFEVTSRTSSDIQTWLDGRHPVIVIEDATNQIIAFANTSTYRSRACYDGVAEFSVYVKRTARREGAGRMAMEALINACRVAGFWKLISRVFPENTASLKLLGTLGFRQVGRYEKHAQLDGIWRDVIIVERLILENFSPSSRPAPLAPHA